MIQFCKGGYSKQTALHKEKISDQASACTQREGNEWEVSEEKRSWRVGM